MLCYQIRQSFKPGEITPEEANRVGYETAMRWTKGKHAFFVAVSYTHLTADYQFRAAALEHPELDKGAFSRYLQKRRIQKQYAKQAREAAKQGAKAAEKTAVTTEKLAARTLAFVKRHPVGVIIALACCLLIFSLQSCVSSMASVGNGLVGAVAASTYVSEDADILGAEAAYCALEDELRAVSYTHLDVYKRQQGLQSQLRQV